MSNPFEFDINVDDFMSGADRTSSDLKDAIVAASHDILNTWQAEARNDAPIETDTLRKNIAQKLEVGTGLNTEMKLTSNAYNDGFNYAYYQHNVRGIEYLRTGYEKNETAFQTLLQSRINAVLSQRR